MTKEISPEEIISEDWLNNYYKEREALSRQLTRLNSNLFIMNRIMSFPFNLLFELETTFWDMTLSGLGDSSIMIIWKLVGDKDDRTLTLKKFHDNTQAHLRHDISIDTQQLIQNTLNKFKNGIELYEKDVAKIRHNYIAHFNYKENIGSERGKLPKIGISISKLEALKNTACNLFDELCFGFGRHLFFGSYGSNLADKYETDIDKLLTLFAKNNSLINMPEEQSWLWKATYREQFSTDNLALYNKWRKRYNKPEVD